MLVRAADGAAVFICARGRYNRPRCVFPIEPVRVARGDAVDSSYPACPTCAKPVDVYETSDGRTLAYRHVR